MRTMYDAVTPSNIPTSAQMVAGYVDGRYAWSAADWARFPGAVKVRIAVFASTNDGHVLDVERYDATPAQAVGWVQRRRDAGVDPTVYCGYSTNGYSWALVINAFKSAGVAEPHYWVAAYPGNGANLYPGSVAHQYADPVTSGGNYDLSVVADYWPGVDSAQTVSATTTIGGSLPTAPGPLSTVNPVEDFLMALTDDEQRRVLAAADGWNTWAGMIKQNTDRLPHIQEQVDISTAALGNVTNGVVALLGRDPATATNVQPLLDAIKALPAETVAAIKAAL